MQTPSAGQPKLLCTPLLMLYTNVWAMHSLAFSATKF